MRPMIVRDDQDKEVGGTKIDGLVVGGVDEQNDEISKTCVDKEPSPNNFLAQALGTQESSECVRGVIGFVTPIAYFQTTKHSKNRFTLTSAHGSCSRPILEYEIQCQKNLEKEKINVTKKVVKEEVNVDVIILNDQHEKATEVPNEKEVVRESNINMPLPLKIILRFAEKACVPRENIIDFCNMREVKTLTLVAYMTYLHPQDHVSNYIFVDPSLISVGQNT
ncbi:uncharacterized protein E5676_scaffold692G00770 [Cucumis melo var. makuwa]|uniref:Uncharacterized protein n=1 Tax=Cucumis melo var. makuwa TaxID=1194695 RepID=A0A5A7V1F9_CUCMM|nr:uncharacterized protein E6C27_scaffold749G00750 [Cucumis melo var. makuwa]TYK14742.1 uncharacterized protein E5676_scaffold692G00770 [Cucumis melo var. makuwa]